jgi:cyclase
MPAPTNWCSTTSRPAPGSAAVDREWVGAVARELDIPFCVAGGIDSVDAAEAVLAAGADKISVNSPALRRPQFIDELARRFGSQCVVVGIDSLSERGQYRAQLFTGDARLSGDSGRATFAWLEEAQQRGAGEIVLNCMNSDGVRTGYDIDQLRAARERCAVPLVASGGAGNGSHFAAAFREAGVDAALAASVFHSGELDIATLKAGLRAQGIEVRT